MFKVITKAAGRGAVALSVVMLLAACSGGEPSESEMKTALDNYLAQPAMGMLGIEIHSFKKVGCKKRHETSYVCDYESEGLIMGAPASGINSGIFTKGSNGWAFQGG